MALLGQQVELACVVEKKRGELGWFRDNGSSRKALGFDGILPSYASHFSLVAGPSAGLTEPANYSLRITSVSLGDDARWYCLVSHFDQQHRRIISRSARLTVLQPPTRLLIVAASEDAAPLQLSAGPQPPNLIQTDHELLTQPETTLATNSDESGDEPMRVTVRQGSRLRLECRTDQAKPRAELVWLDHRGRPVAKRLESGETAELLSEYANSSVYHLEEPTNSTDALAPSTAIWSFQVSTDHHNQLLTCEARHLSFEQADLFPQLFRRELRRQVRIDVQSKPSVTLLKEPLRVYENSSLRFLCQASGNPSQFHYSWFIDQQPVINASEPELWIERATRQLHLREVRCSVSNQVGSSSAVVRPTIFYGPIYASHLVIRPSAANSIESAEAQLASQLALAVEPGQDVNLHCDFDAHPRLDRVLWYKQRSDYSTMADQSPAQANELLSGGALGAQFLPQLGLDGAQQRQLDYEAMSAELLDELAKPADQENSKQAEEYPSLELIANLSPSLSQLSIRESLQWFQLPAAPAPINLTDHALAEPITRLALVQIQSQPQQRLPGTSVAQQEPPGPLERREANLSSASYLLIKVNKDSVGRYVCKGSPGNADNFGESARAIYLVLKRQPRLISRQQQWVSAHETRIQVECLAQIHTMRDASISWHKDGKLIVAPVRTNKSVELQTEMELEGREQTEWDGRRWTLVEYSPDLLFMRSTLVIERAEPSDFGLYNCTIDSPFGADHLPVSLRQIEPTGLVFNTMAALALGSVVILVAILSLLIVWQPTRRPDAKQHQQHSGNLANQSQFRKLSAGPSNRSLDSLTVQLATKSAHLDPSDNCDSANLETNSAEPKMDHQVSQNGQFAQAKFRHSLRQPITEPARLAKFTAIQESLEHKLQLGRQAGQPLAPSQTPVVSEQPAEAPKSIEVNELERGSMLGRFCASLLMRSNRSPGQSSGRRRVKSRPVISMPVGLASSGALPVGPATDLARSSSLRKVPLTNSLSVLGLSSQQDAKMLSESDAKPSSKLNSAHTSRNNNRSGANLVSSSANLIQDSTTASDGSASNSSRSSSSQGQHLDRRHLQTANHINNHLQRQQLYIQHQQPQGSHQAQMQSSPISLTQLPHQMMTNDFSTAPQLANYATNPVYMPQHWVQPVALQSGSSPRLSIPNSDQSLEAHPLDCSIYVNGSNNNLAYQTELITNPVSHYSAHIGTSTNLSDQSPYIPVTNSAAVGYATSGQSIWIGHNQSPNGQHYQHPIVAISEPMFVPSSIQQPYYSTVCKTFTTSNNNNNSDHSPRGITNLPYAHLVATSDAGDTYIENNYDTLISRNKANKALGYGISASLIQQPYTTNGHSTASSSPNSTATHTDSCRSNQNNNYVNKMDHFQDTDENQFSENHVTMVKADGSITTMNIVQNDKGLATHV